VPEAQGKNMAFDPGWFGNKRMLKNEFTIAGSFFVRSCVLQISFYLPSDVSTATDFRYMLVAPSGNWVVGAFPETDVMGNPSVIDTTISEVMKLRTIIFGFGGSAGGFLFNLNGEPSAGTWSFYLVDVKKDGSVVTLTTDEAIDASTLSVGTAPLRLTLLGAN
jgi:hypothetical protein